MLGEFCLRPWHVRKEQSANVLQALLNECLYLLQLCVEPATVSREQVFADFVEFLLAFSQLAAIAPRSYARRQSRSARFAISVLSFSRLVRRTARCDLAP